MAAITSRKHPLKRRESQSPGARLTAATLFTSLALALPATAADIATTPAAEPQIADAKSLPMVNVVGTAGGDYRIDNLSSPKFTQPLLTHQT